MGMALLVAFGLGAFHGLNPAMGWLFSLCLALQNGQARAIPQSLLPISLGHLLSIGATTLAFAFLGSVFPWQELKIASACLLLAFGCWRMIRARHPRWVGMRVGFFHLLFWSFLMATAHGAGLMLWPLLVPPSATGLPDFPGGSGLLWPRELLLVLLHTAGHLWVSFVLAWWLYESQALELLRKAWLNVELGWGLALMATGGILLAL
jgi:hypothetical protein